MAKGFNIAWGFNIRGVTIPLSHDMIHITILKTSENAFLINEEVYSVIH